VTARSRRPAALTIVAVAAGLLVAAPSAARAKQVHFDLGLQDPRFAAGNADTRALWLDRARAAGARTVPFTAHWRSIATAQPAAPSDPADPAYDWRRLDNQIRDATARGFEVLVAINRAPDWAEGPGRDPEAAPGTWRPDSAKLAQFATAIATRYSGSYPDPRNPGLSLPRVRDWQVWAEPNLFIHLNPQFVFRKGNWRAVSPDLYRRLLDAGYRAIKGVDGSNRVVAAGTSPFGDHNLTDPSLPPAGRVAPYDFWRRVLCLRGKKLRKAKCAGPPARLDVLAHNPLSWLVYPPPGVGPYKKGAKAGGPGDVLVPDMRKLQRLIRAARRERTVKPRKRAQLWATELLWETNPPDPEGAPPATQAKWLADALYLLWKQGVSKAIWVRLVDGRGGGVTFGAGLYFADESPKPALTAYRFPFVPTRKKGKTGVWGRAPAGGKVEIQRRKGGSWTTIERLRTRRSNVFAGEVPGGRKVKLRAAIGDDASLERQPR
jgi:hypothetical protein